MRQRESMCDYLESTANCLYGSGCQSEEKVYYTRRQRKCKNILLGITTFLTVANLVVDWYNLVFYYNNTQREIIHTQDTVTDALYWTFLALCIIATVLALCELIAFVLQLRDARLQESPVTRSELLEETVSWCILFFQNLGIPLVFMIGFFLGICPMTAQVRSFSGRLALIMAGVSVLWRCVQSFAFCILCKDAEHTSIPMLCCQSFRVFRAFIIVCSLGIITFLLTISLSLEIGISVDRYNGRNYGEQYSDIQKSVYLYQRISAHYSIKSNDVYNNCSYLETRIEIAKSSDLEEIHKEPYISRIPCSEFSPFYTSFISETHRALLSSYNCSIIVGITNSDLTSARIINAAYELRDTDSVNCLSGNIDLLMDSMYDPKDSYAQETHTIWTEGTVNRIMNSLCEEATCNYSSEEQIGEATFNCDSQSCIETENMTSPQSTLALVSRLLVSKHEVLSYYPCMPNVNLYQAIDLPVCGSIAGQGLVSDSSMGQVPIGQGSAADMVSYTTCLDPYLTLSDNREDWEEEEQQYLQQLRIT